MMLAAELALANVEVAVLERRPITCSSAHGRRFSFATIEVLEQRGSPIGSRGGQVAQAAMFAGTVLDMSDFPTRHPYSLGICRTRSSGSWDWVAELPVAIITDVSDGRRAGRRRCRRRAGRRPVAAARYLVGCDGDAADPKSSRIDFPGWDPTRAT